MNTRQIHHFLALMNCGSLSAAAQSTHLSQPALSRSIRALEETLGVPLFDRTDRRLRPTPYALAWLPRARRMINDEKESTRMLALMNNGESGTLKLGMGSSLCGLVLTPLLQWCMAKLPEVKMRTRVATSDRLLLALRAEQLDYFVGDISIASAHQDLVVEPLLCCKVGWYGRSGHPLAQKADVPADELASWPLMIAGGWAEASLLRRFSELYQFSLPEYDNFSITTDDAYTLQQLMLSTDAIAIGTDFAMLNMVMNGSGARLNVRPAPPMTMTLGIIRLADRMLLPVADRTFDFLRQRFIDIERQLAGEKAD